MFFDFECFGQLCKWSSELFICGYDIFVVDSIVVNLVVIRVMLFEDIWNNVLINNVFFKVVYYDSSGGEQFIDVKLVDYFDVIDIFVCGNLCSFVFVFGCECIYIIGIKGEEDVVVYEDLGISFFCGIQGSNFVLSDYDSFFVGSIIVVGEKFGDEVFVEYMILYCFFGKFFG